MVAWGWSEGEELWRGVERVRVLVEQNPTSAVLKEGIHRNLCYVGGEEGRGGGRWGRVKIMVSILRRK